MDYNAQHALYNGHKLFGYGVVLVDPGTAPRYWLTGKLYCEKCGSSLQGVSGTSGTGWTYYYYYCAAQRRHECTMK